MKTQKIKTILFSIIVIIIYNQFCLGQTKQFSVLGRNYIKHNDQWYTFDNGVKGAIVTPQLILVKLKDIGNIKEFDFSKYNIDCISKIGNRSRSGFYILTVETEMEAFATAEKLEKTKQFKVIRFITCAERLSSPNDQYYSNQWNLDKIMMPETWDIETGDNLLTIAIIDGGVDYHHDDLNNNLWTNPGEIPGDGIDNDQNGFIDDILGWDFYGLMSSPPVVPYFPDNDPYDTSTHGTEMTGIIVAETNNSDGIAGIAGGWTSNNGCTFMPVRVSHDDTNEELSESGILYAGENGAKIISYSYGWARNGAEPTLVKDAIDDVVDLYDVVFISGAGNEDISGVKWPAAYSNTIAVGAINDNDVRKTSHDGTMFCPSLGGPRNDNWGSNYGPELDVVAPGVNLWSTIPTGLTSMC